MIVDDKHRSNYLVKFDSTGISPMLVIVSISCPLETEDWAGLSDGAGTGREDGPASGADVASVETRRTSPFSSVWST